MLRFLSCAKMFIAFAPPSPLLLFSLNLPGMTHTDLLLLLEWLLLLEEWAYQGHMQQLRIAMQPDWSMLTPLVWVKHCNCMFHMGLGWC
jgi:hypothetical protein